MTVRYEKRMVPTEQEVAVADCHNCGKSADVPDERRDYGRPKDWFAVLAPDGAYQFCSKSCVERWAVVDGQTSAELTKLARESFARTAGNAH